jgi:hypothetical protein
MLQIDK